MRDGVRDSQFYAGEINLLEVPACQRRRDPNTEREPARGHNDLLQARFLDNFLVLD